MSSYSPDLGFVPSTYDEIVQRFYDLAKQNIPHSMTFNEFLQSDLYLVAQGIAQLKFDDDLIFTQTINAFFEYLEANQIEIGSATSNTYSGFLLALLEISDNASFINYELDPLIQPAEIVIVLENPDLAKIDEVFKLNLGVSLKTLPALSSIVPDINRSFLLDNGQTVNYWYKNAIVDPNFYVKIEFRVLDDAVRPGSEIIDIQNAFLEEFNRVMKIGTKFEPERYISTQTPGLDYVADFKVGYNLTAIGDPYVFDIYSPSLDTRLSLDLTRIVISEGISP